MLTSVGGRRKEESHNLRIQDRFFKNEELATCTPTCHKGLQKQPVPETGQTPSHCTAFTPTVPLIGSLFPGTLAELSTQSQP